MSENEEKGAGRHVVIDANAQVLRCDHCGDTWPLADGVNGKPVWFACAVMNGFTNEHKDCEKQC